MSNKNYSRWENYQVKIKSDAFEQIKKFNPIEE